MTEASAMARELPELTVSGDWQEVLQPTGRAALEAILPAFLQNQRWFGAKAREVRSTQIVETIGLPNPASRAALAFVRVGYGDGGEETYLLPLAIAAHETAERRLQDYPKAALANLRTGDGDVVLYDAVVDPAFCVALLDMIARQRHVSGNAGTLDAAPTRAFMRLQGSGGERLKPSVGSAEQSNTSIRYGQRLILKLFRKLEAGTNPDMEIGQFLSENAAFQHVPPAAGAIIYHSTGNEPTSLAFLQGFVPNQGDAWSHTLRAISAAFAQIKGAPDDTAATASLLQLVDQQPPAQASALIAGYRDFAALLGKRTAELHLALAAAKGNADFAPEPFDHEARQAVADSMRQRAERAFTTLRNRLNDLPEALRGDGQRILDQQDALLKRLSAPFDHEVSGLRTRVHGDYHLGQVLVAGDDVSIIDFEGEPARPLRDRRSKSSPLQDVAGMLRSFHYAPYAVLNEQDSDNNLEPWARIWQRWVGATFLGSYLQTVDTSPILPQSRQEFGALLDAYLLDKALYELAYELNNRPTWAGIPIEGVLQLL